jgi:hypothetical protein
VTMPSKRWGYHGTLCVGHGLRHVLTEKGRASGSAPGRAVETWRWMPRARATSRARCLPSPAAHWGSLFGFRVRISGLGFPKLMTWRRAGAHLRTPPHPPRRPLLFLRCQVNTQGTNGFGFIVLLRDEWRRRGAMGWRGGVARAVPGCGPSDGASVRSLAGGGAHRVYRRVPRLVYRSTLGEHKHHYRYGGITIKHSTDAGRRTSPQLCMSHHSAGKS